MKDKTRFCGEHSEEFEYIYFGVNGDENGNRVTFDIEFVV